MRILIVILIILFAFSDTMFAARGRSSRGEKKSSEKKDKKVVESETTEPIKEENAKLKNEVSKNITPNDPKPQKKNDIERFAIGGMVGLNFSSADLDESESSTLFTGGIMADYLFSDYFSAEINVLYMSSGYKSTKPTLWADPQDSIIKIGGNGNVRTDYVAIPLIAKGTYPFDLSSDLKLIPFLSLGIEFDILTSSYYEINKVSKKFDFKEERKSLSLALDISIGAELAKVGPGNIFLEGRYQLPLTKQPKSTLSSETYDLPNPLKVITDESKITNIMIFVGYKYYLF